ncbi:S49 family peptidase, partial [Bacteroidota bacterium]
MKEFLKYTLATIAGILVLNFLGFILLLIIVGAATKTEEPFVDYNTVIVAKFNSPILDRASDDPFSMLSSLNFDMVGSMGLEQILKDIKKAKEHEDISGIFLRLSAVPSSLATLQEVRSALLDFKESGKFILAHADAYTQKSYYLASVADNIYMTPTGEIEFKGLRGEVMYYKNVLDKVGVDVQVIRHGSYKSAVEPYMTDKMSEENKEQLGEMISTIWDKVLNDISETRNIPVDDLQSYANELSVTFDKQALEKGMIDGLKYYDEVLD